MGDEKDPFDEIASAIEDWWLSRVLVKGPSIFPTRVEVVRDCLASVRVVENQWFERGKAYFVTSDHPLNQTGGDEVWLHPKTAKGLWEWIDAQAGAEQLDGVM
jgi:hypothetical protein